MPGFVTTYIPNEIHVTKDIEVSFDGYDTCASSFRSHFGIYRIIYRIIYRTILYCLIDSTLSIR